MNLGGGLLFGLYLDFSSLEIRLEDLFIDNVLFLGSSAFRYFWLIVKWCIVLLLHPLPSVLLGLYAHTAFSVSWLRHQSWGGVVST
jgi:hypothetical protein